MLITKYYLCDQIKDDEMGGTCNTDEGYEKCAHNFSRKPWREEPKWETEVLIDT